MKKFLLFAFGLALFAAPGTVQAAEPARRPNVLFISVDDLRPALGCYGDKLAQTPNIDRLAASGMRFSRAYCQQAVCTPSRASLLTGLRPDSTGIYDIYTPVRKALPEVVTLTQLFKDHGYHAVALGKVYHHGHEDFPLGLSEKPWRPVNNYPGYATPENLALEAAQKALDKNKHGPAVEAGDLPDSAYADGQIADRAIAALRENRDRPFFIAAGFVKPHLALACPKKYWDLYRREEMPLAKNAERAKDVPELAFHRFEELRTYSDIPDEGPIPEDKARELVHGYYACTSFTDAQVGRVLAALDELGLRENTVVVLWGDHGFHLGDHGLWTKMTNFENATRAPLLWRVPGKTAAGQQSAALVEFVDVYPTLAEVCGLTAPAGLQGASLAPLFANPQRPWKRAAFSQYLRKNKSGETMGYSIRTGQHRFTQWLRLPGKEVVGAELYDHGSDPDENVNLAALPEHAALLQDLAARLAAGWTTALPSTP